MSPITRNVLMLLSALIAVTPTASTAADRYLIIGGGPAPDASQFSIEQNAIWFDHILRERALDGGRTLFASGPNPTADIAVHSTDDPVVQHWLPLSRLNANYEDGAIIFRPHQLAATDGDAGRSSVESTIRDETKRLRSGDSLLILYSGHGSHQPRDESRNALRLWGNSQLDTTDLQKLISTADRNSHVRFVLPQCFSGAFARSITPNPAKPSISGISGNQCGFFAVSERVEAEGCTPSVATDDYRDYATYFFAAFTGQTRNGKALDRNPDLDGDGKVTLSEAHLYAYTEGLSSDIPRSTSDYYLELWEPWYARWHSFVNLRENNLYLQVAKHIGEKYKLNTSTPNALARQAAQRRGQLDNEIDSADARQKTLHEQAEKLRQAIRYRFLLEWPNAHHPGSAAYAHFVTYEAEPALSWIRSQPDYPELERLQDQVSQLDMDILELQREQAQYARIARALHLAATWENFQRLASAEQQATHAALTACEAWVLPETRDPIPEATATNEADPS